MSPLKKRKLSHDSDGSQGSSTSVVSSHDTQQSSNEVNDEATTTSSARTFGELGVIEQLCEACDLMGFKTPTPIQAQAIPVALQGRDLIGLAETGSGKTAAFTIPILQALMKKPQPFHSLILAPTRELAFQIKDSVQGLGSTIAVKCAVLVGGMDMMTQSIALGKQPYVVVATPGRLLDHLENTKGFSLRQLKYLVLDEADRLLDLDFGPALDKILKLLPREDRRTYLYSATMSSKVASLERASLSNPARISVSTDKYQTVERLLQSWVLIPFKRKDLYLIYILNERAGHTGIIFTRTVNEAQRLSILLKTLGFSAIPIHGQLSQRSRLEALNKFRSKSHNLLVATDVAARGLDIPSVDLVLNYDLPHDSKTYVHRVGRTARAGKSGNAISLVSQYDSEFWLRLEHALGKEIEMYKPLKEEVMLLEETVSDAQREAVQQMKDLHENRGKKGATLRHTRKGNGTKRNRDDMDRDEG